VPGASSVRLCPTKLDFNEQEFARVLIEAFGALTSSLFERICSSLTIWILTSAGGEFVGALTRSVTHLVCAPSDINGDKYTHAVNWGIPVLDPRWLSETARTGRFPELDGFRLGASNANGECPSSQNAVARPAPDADALCTTQTPSTAVPRCRLLQLTISPQSTPTRLPPWPQTCRLRLMPHR
jgi:hypothetical protein